MENNHGFARSYYTPQKNSCISFTGNLSAYTYLTLQLIFLFVIGVSLSHQTIVLFSMFTWTTITLHAAVNLFLAIIMVCAYKFDFYAWNDFKTILTLAVSGQLLTHIGTPTVFWILKALASKEHDKAIYDTMLLIFGLIAFIDGFLLLAMAIPYYFLYSDRGFVPVQTATSKKQMIRGNLYELN